MVTHEDGTGVSKLMRRLSARQGRRVNRLDNRIGTLWSGRFKSSLVDTDSYLMACMRYVELNPVRAGLVERPEDYRWSSYAQRLGLTRGQWLDPDPVTVILGTTVAARRRAYAAYVAEGIAPVEYEFLHNAVRRNQLTGDSRFVDKIAQLAGRRIEMRTPGRPFKKNRHCYN